MVDKVDYKAFDVTSIVILIGHDHHRPVPQATYIFVFLANLKSDDLAQILNFWVLSDLL